MYALEKDLDKDLGDNQSAGREKILIVDDNAHNRAALRRRPGDLLATVK